MRGEIELCDRRDHDGLLVLGTEPGGEQAVDEERRPVVAVELPLEALRDLGEARDLMRDQRVQRGLVKLAEVAVLDPALAAEAEEARHRIVVLDDDAGGEPFGDVRPQLRVVGGEEARVVHKLEASGNTNR